MDLRGLARLFILKTHTFVPVCFIHSFRVHVGVCVRATAYSRERETYINDVSLYLHVLARSENETRFFYKGLLIHVINGVMAHTYHTVHRERDRSTKRMSFKNQFTRVRNITPVTHSHISHRGKVQSCMKRQPQ
eukprot:Blabericola_migrator_1__342@NODE_1087_length_5486_cov_394_414652_g745_i0_p5_GENE_NODE_1087_length_5486_cov_394_414652_g745_i0NODE_1087_length_5486_cov_394_414652_g745_i0_p5_ORF_typecomplete_len134_score20_31_NODE_1087_length_5486_cov_394_414652_g745_i028429